MKIFGRRYIANYILDTWNQEQIDYSYKVYMTSVLKGLAGAETSWSDFVESLKTKPQKESAEQIKTRLKDKFNKMVE